MDNWLGKVARHPTGSQIIGGLTVVAIGAAVTHWWSDIVAALAGMRSWPAATCHYVGGWFTAVVTLPRYALIGWLVLVAVLGIIGGLALGTYAVRIFQKTQAVEENPTIATGQGSLNSPTLTDQDREIIKYIAHHDGVIVPVSVIRAEFGWSDLVARRFVERLEERGLLHRMASLSGRETGFKLSKSGVELGMRLGLISISPANTAQEPTTNTPGVPTRNPPKLSTLQSLVPTKEDKEIVQWIAMYGGAGIHASSMRARFSWNETVCARVANRLITSGLVRYGTGGEVPTDLGHDRLQLTSKGFDYGVKMGWLNADGTPAVE
jgi:hypothetical protein